MQGVAKVLCLLLLSAASANAAQLYRWVDAKGNVEWRDTPPPASVPTKNIQQRRVGDNVIGTGETPFSLQLAMKNHPVTLWATDCGAPCNNARAHLNRRGTPHTEKSPQAELAAFKKISPASEIPLLQVGAITVKGYLESEWENTLDAAGYPRTALATRSKPAAPPPTPAADGAKPTAQDAVTPQPRSSPAVPPVSAPYLK